MDPKGYRNPINAWAECTTPEEHRYVAGCELPTGGMASAVWCLKFKSSLHCSSFWGLPYRILIIYLVKPKKRNYNGDYAWVGFRFRVWGLKSSSV